MKNYLGTVAREAHTFYWPTLTEAAVQTLEGDEAMHAIKVMRIRVDEALRLIDGKGKEVMATVISVSKRSLEVRLDGSPKVSQAQAEFHLVIAPTKNMDRLEWCLEKCTEIGLARVSLITCQNSERRKVRLDRLERIAIAAMKQSGSSWLPVIEELSTLESFLLDRDTQVPLYLAHCRDADKLSLADQIGQAQVMIGPEGDFTSEELDLALDQGAKAVHLGSKRLRTETAAVVACTLMNIK